MTSTGNFVLRPKDRIVFLGDSITEQQLYTNFVESYLVSRYPELKLTFLNAGWGGDTAPGGAVRLERDVLALKPTVVTICYGMNDGSYVPPTQEIKHKFVDGMRQLVSRLKAAGIRIVLLTPGMVDESVNPGLQSVRYNQGGLRVMADEVLALAAAESLPVFDLHKLMNEVDARAKAVDPNFCMIPDSVHPDPAGHLVMAFGLLQALGVPPRQLAVTVDLVAGTTVTSPELGGCRCKKNAFGFTLDLRRDRLPFVVEPQARKVLAFLSFQETYNELKLSVRGLTHACGFLRSETTRSASVTREQLAAGINLFSQWSLPPLQRAIAINQYTFEKNQVFFKLWRMLALKGVDGAFYHRPAHAAGVRLMESLERGRAKLLGGKALTCHARMVLSDQPGELLQNGNFITQWSFRGPFPKPYITDQLGGETAFTLTEPPLASNWIPAEIDLADHGQNLIQVFGQQNDCFAYALTVIQSPVEQDGELLVGSDDGVAVWMNGVDLWQNLSAQRQVTPDQDRMLVHLNAGTNIILLKISQGAGGWGFCARFNGLRNPVVSRRAGSSTLTGHS